MPPPELPPPEDPDELELDELHELDEPEPEPHDPPRSSSREVAQESKISDSPWPTPDTQPSPQLGRESQ